MLDNLQYIIDQAERLQKRGLFGGAAAMYGRALNQYLHLMDNKTARETLDKARECTIKAVKNVD